MLLLKALSLYLIAKANQVFGQVHLTFEYIFSPKTIHWSNNWNRVKSFSRLESGVDVKELESQEMMRGPFELYCSMFCSRNSACNAFVTFDDMACISFGLSNDTILKIGNETGFFIEKGKIRVDNESF